MQLFSPIKNRILQYIDYIGVSKYKFYQDTGITRGVLDKESGISEDNIAKFIAYATEINIEWLLTGTGEMIKRNVQEKSSNEMRTKMRTFSNKTKSAKNVTLSKDDEGSIGEGFGGKGSKTRSLIEDEENGIPLIPINAMGGWGTGEHQVMEYETKRYVVPEFTELNVDFMIRVKGSSMTPKYNSGDLVACKKLSLNDIFFQWNKVYVLDTVQGALIKRIKKGKEKDTLLIISDNERYDPFDLHLSQVNSIAIVVGVIRLE